jgi:hypothetical protein
MDTLQTETRESRQLVSQRTGGNRRQPAPSKIRPEFAAKRSGKIVDHDGSAPFRFLDGDLRFGHGRSEPPSPARRRRDTWGKASRPNGEPGRPAPALLRKRHDRAAEDQSHEMSRAGLTAGVLNAFTRV